MADILPAYFKGLNMNIDREKAEFLDEMIDYWQQESIIEEETAKKLKSSYETKAFDWRKLAQYSIYIALACGVFALGSLLIDDEILNFIYQIYDAPNYVISLLSFAIAAWILHRGNKRRIILPKQQFTNEALLFIGVMLIANGLAYLGKSFQGNTDRYSTIFLMAIPVYAFLGYFFKSRLIWAFALFSLGAWFGTESSYLSRSNFYFLGMNYPLRFVCFGAILTALSFTLKNIKKHQFLFQTTYFIGLLYSFSALWLLSIFGNFASIDQWYQVNQIQLFAWALLSISICIITLFIGFKLKDEMAREFGATFLIINLYSRFFEYFWDSWHKALFFFTLAISFWLIGRKAEKIWNLEFLKK